MANGNNGNNNPTPPPKPSAPPPRMIKESADPRPINNRNN